MMSLLHRLIDSRLWALLTKEVQQMLRNRQLLFLLLFPPTVQLFIFGFALSPDVTHIRLGIVDYAGVPASRDLISALTENQVFEIASISPSQAHLSQQVRHGDITAGLVIPPDLNLRLQQGQTVEVQAMIDGVNAYTAGIASGYLKQMIEQHNRRLQGNRAPPGITTDVIFLYNPGLISSWFFVPGVIGAVLTLTSTLSSSVETVREKDTGTLEQLVMTPASSWEILLAKIIPLFGLLMGDVSLALMVARGVFHLPFRGSPLLFFAFSGLYVFIGISIGILLATLARNKQQVILISFFINLPMIQLSGAIAPIESMPPFFQYLSQFNPLRHYIAIVRGILLKGVGLEVLWLHVLILTLFAIVLLTVSTTKFRDQLN